MPYITEEGEVYQDAKGKPVMIPCEFPTLASFACQINVCRDTLYEWSTARYPEGHEQENKLKYPEFSYSYKVTKEHQERILTQGGLTGAFQGNFAIFTAKNVIGWRDKHDIALEGEVGITFDLNYGLIEDARSIIEGAIEDECNE